MMWSAWMACCVWQAAVVQQSCGMRTRNGGGGYQQSAEELQKKKGNKHITMQYLEQGGYFDVPIHVSQTGLLSRACLHSSSSLLPKLSAAVCKLIVLASFLDVLDRKCQCCANGRYRYHFLDTLTANVSVCMRSIDHNNSMHGLQIAAQQLSVGVTTLKKICRTASVNRWPFRKRTSIERLIERTEYFMPLVGDDDELQQHMAALQALLDFKVS